jgi:hypothetical protein
MWLFWWSLLITFAFIVVISLGALPIIGFPTIGALLLLVGIWTVSAGRSLIKAATAGTIVGWYKSGGNLSCSHFRWNILQQASLHNFGTVIYASIVVDASGVIVWTLEQLNTLLYDSKTDNALHRVASKLQQRTNSSCYPLMFLEDLSFSEASKRAYEVLQTSELHRVMKSETLKYHVMFCALQTFAVALSGTSNIIAAVIAALVCLMIMATVQGPFIALLSCYAHDSTFFQSYNPQVVDSIQHCIRRDLRAVSATSSATSIPTSTLVLSGRERETKELV